MLEGIRVSENAALPGKIAEYVVNARTAVTDPATLIGTTAAATAVHHVRRGDAAPAAVRHPLRQLPLPPWAYTSSFDPNLLIYVPLGQNTAITCPRTGRAA